MTQTRRELLRYGATVTLGLVVDLAVARGAVAFGAPLEAAAALGVACGAAFNYALFELWAFRGPKRGVAIMRTARYLGALGVSMAVRAAAVWALDGVLPDATPPLLILGGGVAVSFTINFLLAKFWVFRSQDPTARKLGDTRMVSESAPPTDEVWRIPSFEDLELAPKRHDAVLVIPVVNEGDRIRSQLRALAACGHPVDVVIADGGSTDGSLDPDFLRSVGVRARLTKTGPGRLSAQLRMAYAWALRQGYAGVLTVDGNGKDGMEAVALFLEKLAEGYDYVQGSRYHPDGAHENTPLERTLANRMIHAPMLSLAGRVRLTDTTNGYRAYSARYLLDPRVQPFRDVFTNYELLFYLTVRAGQLGYRVTEVPVARRYPETGRTPTKISGFGGKLNVLRQTIAAALGRFHPAP
jgi:dolichol-phosphate mannosyltransferase